jgi:hypothetical protein
VARRRLVERVDLNAARHQRAPDVVRHAGQRADADRLGAGVAERQPQRDGHQDRETEHPEQRARLAAQLAQTHQRQLHHRMTSGAAVSHRADAVPSA